MHSNPFSKASRTSVPLPRQRKLRPLNQAPGVLRQDSSHVTGSMTHQGIVQSTMFNDPIEIQQWAASSAIGQMCSNNSGISVSHPGDSGVLKNMSGQNSIFQDSVGIPLDMPLNISGTPGEYDGCFRHGPLTAGPYPTLTSEPTFDTSDSCLSELAYDVPGSADMVYTTSSSSNFFLDEFYRDHGAVGTFNPLPQQAVHLQTGLNPAPVWSSPSSASLEPSLSSSYTQASLFPCNGNSPTSLTTEDSCSNASIHDEGYLPPSLIDYPVQAPFVNPLHTDVQFDMNRLVSRFPTSC